MSRPTFFLAMRLAMCGATFAACASAALAQTTDFAVSAYTTGHQWSATPAALNTGEFVIAWHGVGYGDTGGVFANRFAATGAPNATEWRVNSFTPNLQWQPSVAVEVSGGFVVAWSSGGQDGSQYGVFGQRYDALGFPIGAEFQVNTFTTGQQYLPHVQASPTGGFTVVWTSFGSDGNHFGVAGRSYSPLGSGASEFVVNSYTIYRQASGRMAFDGAGRYVVAWYAAGQDGSAWGVRAQRYDPAPAGPEFAVNTYTTGYQFEPDVAADAAGNFVVVWTSDGQDGDGSGVFGQRFDASGTPQGTEFQVNTYTTYDQWVPHVAYDAEGRFVVSWTDDTLDGGSYGVVARWFEGDGTPLGPEFQVNAYTTNTQTGTGLAVAPNSDLLVTWEDSARQGSRGVYGRVFPDRIFADGFESGLGAWSVTATDGGDLSVTGAAALEGTQGLQGVVDDTVGIWVQDDTPENEGRYRARFRIDPNGFDPGETSGARRTRVLIGLEDAPTRRVFAVVLRRVNGQYALMGRARLDDGEQADTGFFNITDEPHAVEIAWTRASTPDANDGRFQLWIDGALVSTLAGLDNHRSALDAARLGALSVKPTASGTLLWDAFDSRRVRYVGP